MAVSLSEEAKAEIRSLERENGSLLTADVLERAKNEDSALHQYYNWNESEAAEQHWLSVTRKLIQSYRIEYVSAGDVSRLIPGYVNFSQKTESGGVTHVYVRTETALSDEDLRAQLLAQLRAEVASLKRKYGHLVEYSEILRASL